MNITNNSIANIYCHILFKINYWSKHRKVRFSSCLAKFRTRQKNKKAIH